MFRVGDRVEGRCWSEEVRGDKLCTLVEELIERVLAISACGTPNDRLRQGFVRFVID